jgi:hypothetical protein
MVSLADGLRRWPPITPVSARHITAPPGRRGTTPMASFIIGALAVAHILLLLFEQWSINVKALVCAYRVRSLEEAELCMVRGITDAGQPRSQCCLRPCRCHRPGIPLMAPSARSQRGLRAAGGASQAGGHPRARAPGLQHGGELLPALQPWGPTLERSQRSACTLAPALCSGAASRRRSALP